ncbi:cell envelope integrity protein TolA [Acinetobacter haemolyticus]|uniref:cell envelope integrity protein TolA n=1 Tax=Acinetobacter haemolyticus TaxID=29430 RepID=UPI000F74A788|nr:hypothetical protein [Acinetobacter haemolyticus]RSN77981.1 hypothetical protein EA769_03940 [Acinetobacter haemolyticus]
MKKKIKFSDNDVIDFDCNRIGFIQAVSYKESSSDLSQPLSTRRNISSALQKNDKGYVGLFQFGEAALIDLGYYKHWDNNTDKTKANDWTGAWTGKAGINNLSQFLNSPEKQLQAIHEWIDLLCNRLRNRNFNEFYGKTINGIEITESGAIAGAYLVGDGGLGSFFGINGFKGKYKESDGNGVHISKYIEMFNHFDLENCCQRKIYIGLTDAEKNALANKEVIVVSRYNGKYVSGETRVKLKSDEQGNLPVIVRHPNTEIKILADGKESNSIVQKANEKQRATLSDFPISSYAATLETESTPQPKPQTNKTPQELRSEQSQTMPSTPVEHSRILRDIPFNIQIVEGDSGRPIPNMTFFLTYKGNIKKHTADGTGTRKGVIAEEGQDIELSVEGDGHKQVIHDFKVDAALNNQTLKVRLPVHSFSIRVTQNGQHVANTLFSIFYRGREIPKRTNVSGIITVKMLTGFVFGFGVKGKSLVLSRVEKSAAIKGFIVNASAVKASKLHETADEQRKRQQQAETARLQQQQKEIAEKKEKQAQEESNKAKTEADKNNQARQNNSYTQNGGRPITTVSRQAPVTSDTTRYHIYHNGKIKRENKAATGYAEFIYYDQQGNAHNLGKSRFILGKKYELVYKNGKLTGNRVIAGKTYLIDQRLHSSYRKNNIGYSWVVVSNEGRYYLSGLSLASILGAMCSIGYGEYHGSGFSTKDGSSGVESKTHINGINGDFRYLGINNSHMVATVHTTYNNFDWDTNVRFIETLHRFGYKQFLSRPVSIKNGQMLPYSSSVINHHHHVHLQGFSPKIEDI